MISFSLKKNIIYPWTKNLGHSEEFPEDLFVRDPVSFILKNNVIHLSLTHL